DVLVRFGIPSAVGGLAGATLQSVAGGPLLAVVFGGLLLFAGLGGITGFSQRMRFGARVAWFGGLASGLLGGLVGNQGGIRSAALLGFDVERDAFVATATAVALVVDGARIPVALAARGVQLGARDRRRRREDQAHVEVALRHLLGDAAGGRDEHLVAHAPRARRVDRHANRGEDVDVVPLARHERAAAVADRRVRAPARE